MGPARQQLRDRDCGDVGGGYYPPDVGGIKCGIVERDVAASQCLRPGGVLRQGLLQRQYVVSTRSINVKLLYYSSKWNAVWSGLSTYGKVSGLGQRTSECALCAPPPHRKCNVVTIPSLLSFFLTV